MFSDDYRFLALFIVLLLVSIPWYRFVQAFLRQRMSRRIAVWVASGLAAFSLLGAATIGTIWLYLHYPQRVFDSVYWAANPSERYTMRDDLILSHQLIGLSPHQVRRLLGEPTTKYRPMETVLSYSIGYYPSFTTKVRPEVITIQFQNGRVISVQ